MKLQPLNDRVVIKRSESSEKTAGGILLPDTAKDKPKQGEVVAVGPGKMLKDGTRKGLQVKVGDKVLFTAWAGNEYQDPKSDTEYLVMQEEEILAVLG